jgi:hypothetical protein
MWCGIISCEKSPEPRGESRTCCFADIDRWRSGIVAVEPGTVTDDGILDTRVVRCVSWSRGTSISLCSVFDTRFYSTIVMNYTMAQNKNLNWIGHTFLLVEAR